MVIEIFGSRRLYFSHAGNSGHFFSISIFLGGMTQEVGSEHKSGEQSFSVYVEEHFEEEDTFSFGNQDWRLVTRVERSGCLS